MKETVVACFGLMALAAGASALRWASPAGLARLRLTSSCSTNRADCGAGVGPARSP